VPVIIVIVPDESRSGEVIPTPTFPININTATQAELEALPEIGPKTAENIINYRNEHGPFQSIDEIDNVDGIGPVTLEKIKDLITLN
jgi:competence protein ComEA